MPVHVLFGRTRHARRRGVAALVREGRDAVGRPTTLYVTGTWRKRQQLLRDLERRGGFSPDIVVFEAWVAEAWRKLGDGRGLLSPRAAALAARSYSAERGLDLDGPTSRALARAERTTAVFGEEPGDREVAAQVAHFRAWLDQHPTHAREGHALAWLRRHLGPAIAGRHEAVVLDDLLGLPPLAAEVCVAACRAWSAAGAEVVLSLAVGRDRGGVEIGQLLGFEEADDREARVFEPTRALRTAVFEGLVATGEATLLRAGEGGLLEVEPGAMLPIGRSDLADDLAGGRRATSPAFGPVRLGPAPDARAEVERVARAVGRALAAGADPRECLVAVASPLYDPLVEEVFADHDLPWERGGGLSAGVHPTALAVRRALLLRAEGLPTDELLALLTSLGAPGARSLAAWCRAAGVRRGEPSTWVGRLRAWAVRTGVDPDEVEAAVPAASALVDRLPPDGPATAREVEERVRAALALLPEPDPAVHSAILEATEHLVRDLAVGGGPWPAEAVREELVTLLEDLRVAVPGGGLARVQVVGLREMVGLTPTHTWVIGLARGLFPPARRPSALLGSDDPADHDPVGEGRALLAALLRDALGEPWMETVELTWPAVVDGRVALPSPLVAEWLELAEDWPPPPDDERPGRREVLRHACLDPRGRSALSRVDLAWIRAAEEIVASRAGPLGPRDGLLTRPPRPPREVPVTTLETYLRCPQRYWYRHVLRLAEPDVWAPELEPRRRGTALHRILEAFVGGRGLRPLSGDPDPSGAAADLHRVAGEVLDAVEAEGGFDPVYQRYARERWLAGLVDDKPHGVLRAWLDAEITGPERIPEAVERSFAGLEVGPLALRGTIDRVDRVPGGARVVTDYKTGRAPTREEVLLGLSLQPAAYLAATLARDPSLPVAASFLSLTRADDLRRSGWAGDPVALDLAAQGAERRSATPLDATGLREVLDRAAQAAGQLKDGRFPPSAHPRDRAGCATCPYRTVCRRDEERHAP